MAKYTTEVRSICETAAGYFEEQGYNNVNSIIQKAAPKIFDFPFPIFDENYRLVLECKILKHFYTREIGLETVGLWKLKLDTLLNELMPLYNKLYESELLEFDPFYNVDLRKTKNDKITEDNKTTYSEDNNDVLRKTGSIEDEGAASSTRTDRLSSTATDSGTDTRQNTPHKDTWVLESDTPQGSVDLMDNGLENNNYLTKAIHTTESGTGSVETMQHGKSTTTADTGTQNFEDTNANTRNLNTTDDSDRHKTGNRDKDITTVEEYADHLIGNSGYKSMTQMLVDFRNSFINIDKMLIEELEPLFMGLW